MSDNLIQFPPAPSDKRGGPGNTGNGKPPGDGEMEARVAKLEVHAEYIRRDLDEMKGDLKEVHADLSTIKRRMAYFAGAAFIVAAIFGWIVNNRFDQVLGLLTPTP